MIHTYMEDNQYLEDSSGPDIIFERSEDMDPNTEFDDDEIEEDDEYEYEDPDDLPYEEDEDENEED